MKRILFASIIVALSVLVIGESTGLSRPQLAAAELPASVNGGKTLYPVADAWVNFNGKDIKYGTDIRLKVGSEECPGQEFPDRGRALIKFDLSAIPAGVVIESASLQLYLSSAYAGGAATNTISVHRVAGSWVETDVTWNNQPGHSATSYAATDVGLSSSKWYTWDITGLVREWYNGVYSNYGLKLVSAAETTCNMRYFDSRENLYDPRLVITYSASYYLPLLVKSP